MPREGGGGGGTFDTTTELKVAWQSKELLWAVTAKPASGRLFIGMVCVCAIGVQAKPSGL